MNNTRATEWRQRKIAGLQTAPCFVLEHAQSGTNTAVDPISARLLSPPEYHLSVIFFPVNFPGRPLKDKILEEKS